jgi:SfnB family sulfur acquisition oxidoreductase
MNVRCLKSAVSEVESESGQLPPPPRKPHWIGSDGEALEIARTLAEDFTRHAAERDRERHLPWAEIERYTASGLGGILVPRAYGGTGASFETMAEVFYTICAADPALGQIPQNQFAIIQTLKETASEAQKKRWFGDVLNGHRLGNAGPERPSRARIMTDPTARLERGAEGLRVNGTRFYSTGSIFAHWIPFRAADEGGNPVLLLVRRDAPGVHVIDDWNSFGQRTTASGSVVLENVAVEEDDVVHLKNFANIPLIAGPVSQLVQASIDAGIAEGAFQDALAFVRERARPWLDSGVDKATEDPYIIHEVGQLQVAVHAAHEILLSAARVLDEVARSPITEASSARASAAVAEAKILTTEAALDASEKLFALSGSAATRAEHNLDRHWRNARVHTLHDPVRWKYHLLGNYLLNGVFPARHQWN